MYSEVKEMQHSKLKVKRRLKAPDSGFGLLIELSASPPVSGSRRTDPVRKDSGEKEHVLVSGNQVKAVTDEQERRRRRKHDAKGEELK